MSTSTSSKKNKLFLLTALVLMVIGFSSIYQFNSAEKKVEPKKIAAPEKVVEPEKTVESPKVAEPEKIVKPKKIAKPEKVVEPKKTAKLQKIVQHAKIIAPKKATKPKKAVEPKKIAKPKKILKPAKIIEPKKTTKPKKVVLENDPIGVRMGIGFGIANSTYTGKAHNNNLAQDVTGTDSADSLLFLELGYDFNRIWGVSATLGQGAFSHSSESSATQTPLYKYKGETDFTFLKLSTDIGYTFAITSEQSIKPYIELGYAFDDITYSYSETNSNNNGRPDNSASKPTSEFVLGIGARYNFNHLFYTDLSYEKFTINSTDLNAISLSIGRKF